MTEASAPRAFPLTMVSEDETVRVVSIEGGGSIARRVTEMGIHVGSAITVRGRQGGGIVVACGETRYALGGGMAHRILVCEMKPAPEGEGG